MASPNALSSVVKQTFDAGTLVLKDGTGTPLTLTVRLDMADVKVTGMKASGRETVAYESRGKLRSLRKGKVKFPTVSFSAMVTDLSETGTGTVWDWLHKTSGSPFASRISTTATIGDADTFTLMFTQEGTTYGDSQDQTLLIEDIGDWEFGFEEGEPNKFTITGTVYGDIDVNATASYVAPR